MKNYFLDCYMLENGKNEHFFLVKHNIHKNF